MPHNFAELLNNETTRHILWILVSLMVAVLIQRVSRPLAARAVNIRPQTETKTGSSPERRATLQSLYASALTVAAFAGAILVSLGQFVSINTLVWMVGLFSAAFGLGARPLISDFLAGLSFLFEDTFAVGEKVEILDTEGIVEEVNLRTTSLRAPTGELYVVPNGEIRVVRNFSRGRFSTADIKLAVPAGNLDRAYELLMNLGREAVFLLPNLLEPWQVISEQGAIGQQVQLTLLAKARFGKAAEMRPRLLALIRNRLAEAGIDLGD
jgi:moderate conductance mechanosensitive channel